MFNHKLIIKNNINNKDFKNKKIFYIFLKNYEFDSGSE